MKRIKVVRDLKSQVYKNIKDSILNRTLLPGTQLKESELVNKLGVSRTPIREALSQLSQEGVIEIFPNKGAFVKSWEKEEVLEVLVIREVLEGLAAKLACGHRTPDFILRLETYLKNQKDKISSYQETDEQFHSDIIQTSKSKRLIDLIQSTHDNLEMMDMREVSFKSPERIKESMKEHHRIIDAFKAGDSEKVEFCVRDHFRIIRSFYQAQLELTK
ncbi:MAG: GntR family transcriptional regulator [Deltaproteobacteria bacterium]|jgi:DNA-binding GntR family transcriptional regulator|nr:GntR family transcriptional regulator [Deltaproteobacteria bacterium]MBT4526538.1 GntR family transcriptional regulator [Deltaproteobacteria bacterium]